MKFSFNLASDSLPPQTSPKGSHDNSVIAADSGGTGNYGHSDILWGGAETNRSCGRSTASSVEMKSPFGFNAIGFLHTGFGGSPAIVAEEKHIVNVNVEDGESEMSNECEDHGEVDQNPAAVGIGGGVALKGLGKLELDLGSKRKIDPYFADVDICEGDCDSFIPEKVHFVEVECLESITHQYEAFDWDAFDEEEEYGPLPSFNYLQEMSLDCDPSSNIDIIVHVTAAPELMRSILRANNRHTQDEERDGFVEFSRKLDGSMLYHSPIPCR
eukprot:GHVH01012089.1.p1 GENE.GHVH01012089.1~~GHVH01012089.1.p1  ORF type:complete len:271 (+),score=35.98 GHVH01012089.1:58-870(+)